MMLRILITRACQLPAIGLIAVGCVCFASPASAQDLSGQDEEAAAPYAAPAPVAPRPAGMIGNQARSSIDTTTGRADARSRRVGIASVEPMERVESRVQNRVQNRIRNRIDRNYDPSDTTTSPFETAVERERRAGRPRNR